MGNCSSSDHNTGMKDLPVVCSASFGMGFGARGVAYAGVVMFVSGFGGVFGGRGVSDCLRLISGSAESGVVSASGLGSWAGRIFKFLSKLKFKNQTMCIIIVINKFIQIKDFVIQNKIIEFN